MIFKPRYNRLCLTITWILIANLSSFHAYGESEQLNFDGAVKENNNAVSKQAPKKAADQTKRQAARKKSALPTAEELVTAAMSALENKISEQEADIAKAKEQLAGESEVYKNIFDKNAYMSLQVINSASLRDYTLNSLTVLLDGKKIAEGSTKNRGLPIQNEILQKVSEGRHTIKVKGEFTREKNTIINTFKVARYEKFEKELTFIAKDGYKILLTAEGFEESSIAKVKRTPSFRFLRSVRPNFLVGAAVVPMNELLNQGVVNIAYNTDESSTHRLISKFISIDGLDIVKGPNNLDYDEEGIVFRAPIAEGKHKLNVMLVFGEKANVKGGPEYNFKLKYDRDFNVVSGKFTDIVLTGMPKNGFRSNPRETRYAKAVTQVKEIDESEFFPNSFSADVLVEQKVTDTQAEQVEEQNPVKEEEVQPTTAPKEQIEGELADKDEDKVEPSKSEAIEKADDGEDSSDANPNNEQKEENIEQNDSLPVINEEP